ncbi:MAG: hypothetical protein VKP62_11765 [Candidatus Sericytochromatia bacterium]|nr:hypothetical protein [Candidatus Sericytochromatia bacterium]
MSEVDTAYMDDLHDPARARRLPLKAYFPRGSRSTHPLVIFSHGYATNRLINTVAREAFRHLGTHLAARGYVVIHLQHPDRVPGIPEAERPRDVSFLLDALAAQRFPLPGFGGQIDLRRVGHAGHSAGAHTAFALAGARIDLPGGPGTSLLDPRIRAIAPISARGSGEVGGPRGVSTPADAWRSVQTPVFMTVGEAELGFDAFGQPRPPSWRLEPWEALPNGDKYLAVLPEAGHSDFDHHGRLPASAIRTRSMAYVRENIAAFFDVYLKGEDALRVKLGEFARPTGARVAQK